MRKRKIIIPPLGGGLGRGLFCLLLTANCLLATAQTFPVQVIPQVTPPAPIYFSDYADPSTVNSPLRVQIILNDFEIANREIRLRTYFEGGGIAFQSNDVVIGANPLFLEGGVPLVLTNVELAPYFRYENISGISPNVYGKVIPEGAYTFCFEVYDVLTGNRISQRSCATSVVFQNEPPFLISPRNKTNVEEINPQNIVFQWTPRHINVTNVEYELSIVEIWDTQVDPQQAFLSSPPVFQTTTSATTYVYGPSDPLFLSGKNYAWRIQAKAKQGIEEIGLFENQGYSEIYSFSYAGSCDLPIGIANEVKGSTNANIFWDDFSTEIPEYTVRYRKVSSSGENAWFLNKTTSNQTTLWDLKAGTTYEYHVRKKCTVTESDWSIAKQFTTFIADNEASVYECGITPDFNLTNKDPLSNISPGDAFTAGDFPIKILEVSGSNGRFTGKGYVTIPYLNSIKVGVEFTNVLINTDNRLAEGTVTTMYDPDLQNILDVDDAIDTVEDIVDSTGEFFEGNNDLDEIKVDWEITKEDITIENGMVVITNPYNGVTTSEPLGDDMTVVDSAGNTYYVDADGNVTEGGQIDQGNVVNSDNVEGVSNNGQIQELTAKGIRVTFTEKGTYGMDVLPKNSNAQLKDEYAIIKDADGEDYPLVHHAVKKNGTTKIEATIVIEPGSTYTSDQVVFKNKQGQEITADVQGNKATLTLNGTYTFENETIYATVPDPEDDTKELTAGAFILWHLTEKTINVVLVSVNGGQLGNVEAEVNNIFEQGVAQINFGKTIDLRIDEGVFGSNGLDVGESAWTKAYNEEQKEFIQLAKNAGANGSDTYYVLVCGPDITNTKGIAGFMPLQRQFGFVFQKYVANGDEGKGNVAKTLAHEIGHGVFALQHPFSQYGMPQEATDWLMDYGNGAVLPHTHWAQMHDPAIKFYVFKEESEGEISGKIWFTPDWEPFTVENTSTITSVKTENVPLGTIPGFKLNGKFYHAEFEAGKFLGYFANYKKEDKAHDEYLPNKISSLDSDAKVYLFQYNGGCGYNRYYETKYYYANANKTSISYGSDSNIEFVDTIPCAQSGTENKNPFKASLCELINKDDNVNAFGVENAIEKLNEAYAKRKAITDISSPRTKGEFYHLVNVSTSDLDGRAEFIEDKLYFLKQKTGINFFVIFQPVDTKMNPKARDDFAQQVLTQSNLGKEGKSVVITVSYFTLTPLASFSPINCIQPGFAQNDNSIVRNQSFRFKQADNLLEYVLGAYTDIEKPLFIRRYFLKANGTLVNQEIETKSGKRVREYPYINEVEFYESPKLEEIRRYQSLIKNTSPQLPEMDVSSIKQLRNGWIQDLNKLFEDAEQEEINSFNQGSNGNIGFWGEKKDIQIGKFREVYIRNLELTNTYVGTNIDGTYLESWKIIFARSNLEPKHFYDFDVWTVVDQTAYNTLDVIGLVPGLDTFTDLGGLLYAGLRGDLENTVIYSGSLIIPFAGSGYLKGVKNGVSYADEAYAITAKKVNGTIEFDVKRVSEINPDELQVSTILTNDEAIAKKIKNETLENHIIKDDIAKLFDEVIDIKSNIIPDGPVITKHIFSKNDNKLLDTLENRELLENLTNNPENLMYKDEFGKEWYAILRNDGSEVYAYTRNGIIKGAGINKTPRFNCN